MNIIQMVFGVKPLINKNKIYFGKDARVTIVCD